MYPIWVYLAFFNVFHVFEGSLEGHISYPCSNMCHGILSKMKSQSDIDA